MKNENMKNTKSSSVAERIMKVISKTPSAADKIRSELKDRFGYNINPEDIRVNLLYLLRREKIKRKKDGKIYQYYI